MRKAKIYGYVRISTVRQNKERQVRNIQEKYPKAVIFADECTGKTMDRPEWSKLYPQLQKGDVVVFDEVSRMSRNAEEGFRVYEELFNRGVELIFLKEPHINTETYKKAMKTGVSMTGTNVDFILEGVNKYLLALAKDQIRMAFEQSQAETDLRSQRQKEGIETARLNGKQIGRKDGDVLNVKKKEPIMNLIRKYSRDFDGTLTDAEVLAILKDKTIEIEVKKRSGNTELKTASAKLSRNTLYKYKKEMREGTA